MSDVQSDFSDCSVALRVATTLTFFGFSAALNSNIKTKRRMAIIINKMFVVLTLNLLPVSRKNEKH